MKDGLGLPLCNLKTCQYNKTGQCNNKTDYYNCPYTIAKLLKFKNFTENKWLDRVNPEQSGMYKVLILDTENDIIYESIANYNGSEFIWYNYGKIIAWKHL